MKIDQEGLQIQSRTADEQHNISVVEIGGYVDQGNCHLLQQIINSLMDENRVNLIFDFSNLIYMSSAGWGVLIGEIKGFRENDGDIKLANMGPEIYEIYQMLEFYHIISEYPSVEAALNSFLNIEVPLVPPETPLQKPKRDKQKPGVEDGEAGSQPQDENSKPRAQNNLKASGADETGESKHDEGVDDRPDKKVVSEQEINLSIEDLLADEGILKQPEAQEIDESYIAFDLSRYDRELDVRVMPIPDKIRSIVAKHPDLGAWKIKKMLRLPEYGETKIGYFKVRSLLKMLELDTKQKRYRYFRSA